MRHKKSNQGSASYQSRHINADHVGATRTLPRVRDPPHTQRKYPRGLGEKERERREGEREGEREGKRI
jgi:hypothetical protein